MPGCMADSQWCEEASTDSTHLEDLGQDGGGEEGGMLDDNKISLVLIGHAQLIEQGMRGLAHNHGTEELATQPGAPARRHALLNNGHLQHPP